jgi:nucleotide-binding universal stress UspA family protein
MNDEEVELVIRRIMVAVDTSMHSLAALEAASELADALKAELVGVFVEDINLLHLAGLPFAREVRYLSRRDQPLHSVDMERELRVQAAQVRQALASVAARRQLRWSFRVVRGRVAAELLTAAQEADLLALGRASGTSRRRVQLGATARIVVAQAPHAVLLLQHGHAVCQPLQVVYDGSTGTSRALATAVQLAPAVGGQLTVILLADAPETVQRLREEAGERLQGQEVQVRYRQLISPTADALAHAVRMAGGGTLVISAQNPLLAGDGLYTVLEAVDCSALLVR